MRKERRRNRKSEEGQTVVEYILLLSIVITAFFAVMGCVNLYVAGNYSTETWVNFKLFGSMGLMLVFVVLQALMLAKHVEDGPPK